MNTLATILALVAIGAGLWLIVRKQKKPDTDIERQIATLRKHADHSVSTRPRVRDGGYQPIGRPGTVKAPPRNPSGGTKPKACGGGMCRHRSDCADHYCPGRMANGISGATSNPCKSITATHQRTAQ
jgi:hypothetical protein